MSEKTPQQSRLCAEAKYFRILATIAVTVSLFSIAAQVLSVAAPIWRGGQLTSALINVIEQLVLSVPAIVYVYGLVNARRVFARIGQGDLFASANSKGLIVVGGSLLVGAVWSMLLAGFVPMAEVHDHEAHRYSFAAADIALAALGLALIMIARVMKAATVLKADSDGFV